MTVIDCENIVKLYFEEKHNGYEHIHNRNLKFNEKDYKIRPDDRFSNKNEIILVEYENTKRPVESISKYWWLLANTKWTLNNLKIKLLLIGLNKSHKGIRDESVKLLGSELMLKFPQKIDFYYIPWSIVNKDEIINMLNQITNTKPSRKKL